MVRRSVVPLILAASMLSACGGDVGPAVGGAAIVDSSAAPWEGLPPESIYGATAVDNLTTTRVDLDLLDIPPGWNGMTVAVLSDLDLGRWNRGEDVAAAAVQRAVSLDPDLIVLLGDYVTSLDELTALERVLAPLRGRATLAVLGDQDITTDTLAAALTAALDSLGIRVLRNTAITFVHNGDSASIAGLDPELATSSSADQAWILSQLGGPDPALLLTHAPVVAAREPDGRFPAILAGNTFCGTVPMPGTPNLSWLREVALPGAAVPGRPRLFSLDGSILFVTCGVGFGFIPVRFGAPPEVALVTLDRVPSPNTAGDSTRTPADSLLDLPEAPASDADSVS